MDAHDMDALGNALGITLHYINPHFRLDHKLVKTLQGLKQPISLLSEPTPFLVKKVFHLTPVWSEAENQIFVAKSTSIPVPKVFAAFTHRVVNTSPGWPSDNNSNREGYNYEYHLYILMEVVPGDTLDDIWEHTTAEVKQALSAELKGYVKQLREIRGARKETYIGSLGKGPVLDKRFGADGNRGMYNRKVE